MKKQILLILFILLDYYVTGQVMKLTSGATLASTGDVVITLDNLNLEIDGTLDYARGSGQERFVFKGNQNTTISGTGLLFFADIEIAKTGGAELSLMRRIFTNNQGNIYFTSGLINLNNNSIHLSPYSRLYNESETSRLYGPTGGFIEIQHVFNYPSFNPGNLGLIISTPSGNGTMRIRRGHQSQPIPTAGKSILRYYDIIPGSTSSLNSTFGFHYFDAELNGLNENTLAMWKSPDNINWTNQGFTSINTINNYVENSGADFSRWTLSEFYGTINRLENTYKVTGNDGNTKDQWKAWPNPADQTFHLNIIASSESKAVIKISDSKGALVEIQHHYLMRGSNQLNIDIKKLAAGVYHVFGEWDNGKTKKSVKLVKL